jgi:sugar phosphate isomerase/epimerase
MKTAITLRTKTHQDTMSLFRAANECGYDGVQAKPAQYEAAQLDPEKFRETFGDGAGLIRAGVLVYLEAEPVERWMEIVAPVIRFAGGVGAEEICLCSSLDRSDLSEARFQGAAEVMNAIGSEARPHSIGVSMHNHAGCMFQNADDLAKLTAHLDPALAGVTFDTAHAAMGGVDDLAGTIVRFADHIRALHLKDMTQPGQYCLVGRGSLDLAGVLEAMTRVGPRRWVMVDEESSGMSVEEACRLSMDFLQQHGVA